MYIAFEGVDTVGKSTQIELLSERFDNVVVTKEPGGTALGERLREILLEDGGATPRSEVLLFLADRAEHTEKVVRPNLHRMILSDRSFISGIAYAHVHEKIEIDTLLQLNRFATSNIFPDRIILFHINKRDLRERMGKKSTDAIELRGIDYMMRVQKTMEEIVDLLQIDHILIDAAEPIEEINEKIYRYIKDCQK
ncbi:MAG: dTMP kinase [Hydrogenimonas sp.]|nr:dTMP kinase [Hydrogenimonas sp.]